MRDGAGGVCEDKIVYVCVFYSRHGVLVEAVEEEDETEEERREEEAWG